MAKVTIDKCKCWPTNKPYVENFTDFLNQTFWNSLDIDGSLPWCDIHEIKSNLIKIYNFMCFIEIFIFY